MAAVAPPAPPTTTDRFFNDPINSVYLLPADSEEGQRLNLQHVNLTHAIDGQLVLAPLQLQPGDRVLECATGTGVWLLELAARSAPEVFFTGVDLSPHLFPPSAPPNVAFARESILALPSAWTDTFALVHQRLVLAALREPEWPAALRAHFGVLHPGGWVQLCEAHPPGHAAVAGPRTRAVREMHMRLMRARGLDPDCAVRLPGWLRAAGFVNVTSVCKRVPVGAKAGAGPHNYGAASVRTFLAMKGGIVGAGIASAEEYERAVAEMREEWDELEDAYIPFYWVWAQKPVPAA